MTAPSPLLRVVLICHEDDSIDCQGIASWLASSFSLAGIVLLKDKPGAFKQKLKREYRRVGILRLLDVLLFRLFYKFRFERQDTRWMRHQVENLQLQYPANLTQIPVIRAWNPNCKEVQNFISELSPDFALARCKHILKSDIFTIPRMGTFVLHPGICPSYRNAHGCFWALVNRDLNNVGMTLIKVDSGIDTGPMFLRSSYLFDEFRESHVVIQHRVVLENLDKIASTLYALNNNSVRAEIARNTLSRNWGQPWMSAYVHWKRSLLRTSK